MGELGTVSAGLGKSITAAGIQTNYHEAGSGKPIVLLHGSGPGVSAWTNWRKVIPALADQFHVLAPDMAGFGYTERQSDIVYDIKLWVKHLIGFLDALGLEKVSLVGNSFGGSLSLAAALKHPDRFDRLVLMGTPCDKFEMTEGLKSGWYYEPSLETMRKTMMLFPYDKSIVTDALVQERYETSLIPGAQEGLRKLLVKPNEDGPTLLSGIPESAAAKIVQPTLVLHGREDKVVPTEMGLKLGRSIPNAEFHMFGQCGHWVQAERFDGFVALTRRHFA